MSDMFKGYRRVIATKDPFCFRFLFCVVMVLAIVVATSSPAEAARRGKKVNKYASFVVDTTTGKVLSQRYADDRRYPASLTKMMTLYMTFNALEKGLLRKSQRLRVSKYAASQEPSSLRLKPGDTIRVHDAILALVTKSANDVAVVLAEGIGGSEAQFAKYMTQKARQLGMHRTVFTNASGLFHPRQVSTARDMATLSIALMQHFPQHYHYFKTTKFTYAGKTYRNHNKLMRVYDGMDGIKTGYVHKSGFNLSASVVRDGHRLVGVVFGGRTSNSRNAHMAAILDRGFAKVNRDKKIRLATVMPQRKPKFDTIGLVMNVDGDSYATEEGDAPDPLLRATSAAYRGTHLAQQMRPRSINVERFGRLGHVAATQGWMVQVGAFSNQAAGHRALSQAKRRLPAALAEDIKGVLIPLPTDRGMIYRARLAGLNKDAATSACRILQGTCLIMAVQ